MKISPSVFPDSSGLHWGQNILAFQSGASGFQHQSSSFSPPWSSRLRGILTRLQNVRAQHPFTYDDWLRREQDSIHSSPNSPSRHPDRCLLQMLHWHLPFPEWVVWMLDNNQHSDTSLAHLPTPPQGGDGVWAVLVACSSTQEGDHYCDYGLDSSAERWERQTQPIILISTFFSQKTAASSSYIPQLFIPPPSQSIKTGNKDS